MRPVISNFFRHHRVRAEARKIDASAGWFVVSETCEIWFCRIHVNARIRSDINKAIIAKTTKALQKE